MIQVQNLRKNYGNLTAVDDVSFTAPEGAIYGLLGPNGAGKTTSLGCVSGLLKPSGGQIQVQGHNVVTDGTAARKALGVVPQEIALYLEVSATENLKYWGGTYGLRGPGLDQRIESVLELTGLSDRAKEPVSRFSGGMKRRLNFACGIVHEPQVLLLDEPTVGVDPQSRVRILDLVRDLAKTGTCILYTTHYMEEAQSLCDFVGIMDHGKLIAEGTITELRNQVGEKDVVRLSGTFPTDLDGAMGGLKDVEIVKSEPDLLTLAAAKATSRLPEILHALDKAGAEIHESTLTQPSLESLFIKLTGKELRE